MKVLFYTKIGFSTIFNAGHKKINNNKVNSGCWLGFLSCNQYLICSIFIKTFLNFGKILLKVLNNSNTKFLSEI